MSAETYNHKMDRSELIAARQNDAIRTKLAKREACDSPKR